MSVKLNAEIEECVRNNVTWSMLPDHLQQVNSLSIRHGHTLFFMVFLIIIILIFNVYIHILLLN